MMRTSVTAKLLEINVARGKGDKRKPSLRQKLTIQAFLTLCETSKAKTTILSTKLVLK